MCKTASKVLRKTQLSTLFSVSSHCISAKGDFDVDVYFGDP